MTKPGSITRQKSMDFAVRIYGLYTYLCDNKKEFVLSKQVLRSGTSIGANLSEAACAISENDFIAKLGFRDFILVGFIKKYKAIESKRIRQHLWRL